MKPTSRTVFINGESRQIRAESVTVLVEELGLSPATVLVEHNGDALQRSEWPNRAVKDGDRLEILRVAAGG
jgi:sulfur carrier protein